MIGFINGKLEEIIGNSIIINCGGVGFEIMVSQLTISNLGNIGETFKVYTYLNVKEDEMSLYGFANMAEKQMFLNLTSVSGVGPKTAISILSEITLYDLASSIASGDAVVISKVKGIGKKTAERIVLELREKIEKSTEFITLPKENVAVDNNEFEYAINVLVSLGLNKFDATRKLREIAKPEDKAEDLIQKVLRSM